MTTLAPDTTPDTNGIATLGSPRVAAIIGRIITMIADTLGRDAASERLPEAVPARDLITVPGVIADGHDWLKQTITVPGVRADGCDWLRQALNRLETVAILPRGWDSEGGPPPNSQLVRAAADILRDLQRDDLPLPFVCPIAGGGLQLEWSSGGKEVELELVDERTIGFLRAEAAPSGRIIESGEYPISDINKSRELLDWLAEA